MEGSQAGLAGGGDAGQAQGQEAAQQQGPDIGQLAQNLETLQSGQEELRQFLMSAPWQQQVQEVQEAEPELDLSYLMPQQEMDGSELAQRLGQTITEATDQRLQSQPELANKPWFWRLTYMAGRAAEAANEEGGETPQAAHLEGGGGARPGGQQVDLGDADRQRPTPAEGPPLRIGAVSGPVSR
jgi:hypothetical protein